ncbi:unnamed protein product [Prorocentrum cordatum]|uniref:C2 domain-containing protein n=1 Tax=Prorocentrum cordatum TaxID=2364126 RepID=A0ABN9TJS6_9DINO|nr:unnamed protein product [Polarella glacialis]
MYRRCIVGAARSSDHISSDPIWEAFRFVASDARAVVSVGDQRRRTRTLPGCCPRWGEVFNFNVHAVDTALRLEVYRQHVANAVTNGLVDDLLEDKLVGLVEVPFLDLDEWSGSDIGRVLENPKGAEMDSESCMLIEFRATLDWY